MPTKIVSAYIAGTNGYSNGIVPMLRAFDATARYVDQGGNKRPGAFAIYLEPWHADVFEFLDLRKNHGKEEVRAHDLFCALWIPDLLWTHTDMFSALTEVRCSNLILGPDEALELRETCGAGFEGV